MNVLSLKYIPKLFFIVGIFIFSFFFFSHNTYAFSGAGAGTELDPYEITTCEQLQEMNDDLTADYELMNDIDCSMTNPDDPDFDPLGTWGDERGFLAIGGIEFNGGAEFFSGTLEGNNHTVNDIFINSTNGSNGLIGAINGDGGGVTISNIGVVGGSVNGSGDIGCLVGYIQVSNSETVEITNTHASCDVNSSTGQAGGLIGHVQSTIINNSYATGSITTLGSSGGGIGLGGLVGIADGGDIVIARSYATGNVNASLDVAIGGLIGFFSTGDSFISQSYATGNVAGDAAVGGFVGLGDNMTISDSYSTGSVTAGSDMASGFGMLAGSSVTNSYSVGDVSPVGTFSGFLIDNGGITVTSSFWDTESSTQADSSGGGEGKTTEEMKSILTFSDALWDIGENDDDPNNGYPYLSWQIGESDPVWYLPVPSVTLVSPADGATDVALDETLIIDFSQRMNTGSVVISTSPCDDICPTYDSVWSNNNAVLMLTRSDNGGRWSAETTYTLEITSGKSENGTSMSDSFSWSFTTTADESEPAPTRSSGGGTSYGCTDPTALNYKPKFVKHKQSLCEYATPTPVATPTTPTTQPTPTVTFTRDLKLGMTGEDVNRLQNYLITQNKGPAALALKNHGTTNYFGPLTQAALIEYQKSMNITPAIGFFGPITRGVVSISSGQ